MISGNFIKALAQMVHLVIQFYIIVIIVRSVISWLGNIRSNQLVVILRRLTDPVFRFVHRHLPFTIVSGIDISPILIIVFLYFVDNFLTGVLLGYAEKLMQGI